MSAFTRANPIGWSVGNPVTAAQMNALDLDHVKAPNFVDGLATYNPVGLIQIGGAGFQWNGPSAFASTSTTAWAGSSTVSMLGTFTVSSTGSIVIGSSGEISVTSGGDITLATGSAMTWQDGSLIEAEDGSTFQLNDGSVINFGGIVNFGATSEIFGTLDVNSAATTTINGSFTLGNSQNVQLSPARTWTRRNLRMCATAQPADIDHENGGLIVVSGSFIHCIVVNSTVTAFASLLEIDDLPDGQTITSVTVRTKGDSAAPATINRQATYQVIRWTDESTLETMSAVVSDSHTIGNWTSAADQSITITSHATIDRSYRYAVQVVNHRADNSDEMNIVSVVASGTATSIRV